MRGKQIRMQHVREVLRLKSEGSAQKFVAIHGAVYNTFNFQRHLICRNSLRLSRNLLT
jgi:hypothetical protein